MKQLVLIVAVCASLFASTPRQHVVASASPQDATLMTLDRTTHVLTVNDDWGHPLGTVAPDGTLSLVKGVQSKRFFVALLTALREGTPTPDDTANARKAEACMNLLNMWVQSSQQ